MTGRIATELRSSMWSWLVLLACVLVLPAAACCVV